MEQNNYRGNNEIRNNNVQNNVSATKVETETKANVLSKVGEFAGQHKEAIIVAGVMAGAFALRKPIAKAGKWVYQNTLGRLFAKKKEDAPAASTEAKEEQPAK